MNLETWGTLIVTLSWNELEAKDPSGGTHQMNQSFQTAWIQVLDDSSDPSLVFRMTG